MPVVSYSDDTGRNLKVAHCTTASCSSAEINTVDSEGDVGTWTSIAIGTDGLPIISYYDSTNTDLKVVRLGGIKLTLVSGPGSNEPPVVDAGPDQTIAFPPDTATLSGSVTDTTVPGVLTSTWSKVGGPGMVTFTDPSSPTTSATFSETGLYTLRLTASDGLLSSSSDLTITFEGGEPPVVDAGPDQTITFPPNTATLSGSVTDTTVSVLTSTWTSLSNNPGMVTFTDPNSLTTSATFGALGLHTLRLTASDGLFESFDEVDVLYIRSPIDWAKSAGNPSTSASVPDIGSGITALTDNSLVVTGFYRSTATFGAGETNETILTSAGNTDIFVARYNSDGTLAWAKSAGGTSFDRGNGITALTDNSVVVTGEYLGTATFGAGETNETVLTSVSAGNTDIFVARYNSDGTLAWAKSAGSTFGNVSNAITALTDNSVVVTGSYVGTATFGAGETNETVLTSGTSDIFVARYNSDGTLAWAKSAGGSVSFIQDIGFGITALSDNSVVVTGQYAGPATFGAGEAGATILTSVEASDIFVAKYNPDGTLAFAKGAGGTNADIGNSITALTDDSVVITGEFFESATFGAGETNETVLTAFGGTSAIFVAGYNSDGTLAWAKSAGGTAFGGDKGLGITTLSDNSVVVTGHYSQIARFGVGDPNETLLTSAGFSDIFLARYNPDGTLILAKSAGGAENDVGNGITALSDDSIVITGSYAGTATFGAGDPNETVLTSAGGADIFVARYGGCIGQVFCISIFNVSIPAGTSVPGCEQTNECFIPPHVTIIVGDTVIWSNADNAAHTVTSGNPTDGLDGNFDSSLILPGNDFTVKFDGIDGPAATGTYDYFCQIHPWQSGMVTIT